MQGIKTMYAIALHGMKMSKLLGSARLGFLFKYIPVIM